MVFTNSSGPREAFVRAVKHAAEALVAAVVIAAVAACVWRAGAVRRGIFWGIGAAWAASGVSLAAQSWAREISLKAFGWALGGGIALRLAGLFVLGWAGSARPGASQSAALASYALGVLFFLIFEYRRIKIQ